MEYNELGETGIKVSRLCFGSLSVGPLQVNLSVEEGSRVICRALEMGVNFIDTAELYQTYDYIREAIRLYGDKPVIASKTYAYDRQHAAKSVEKARREMDVDVVDIFLLHEQESRLTLKGHREALEFLIDEKIKGRLRAVGVSTHNIEVVDAAAEMPEIDIIHPIVNVKGLGINDGTIEQMLHAIEKAYSAGKGIYAMKPLGGGNLLGTYENCMKFVLDIPHIHSIAVGMQSVEEVEMNVMTFNGETVPEEILGRLRSRKRAVHVEDWCEGCATCEEVCPQKAIKVAEGRAEVDKGKCILCGYCGARCPAFAIRVL